MSLVLCAMRLAFTHRVLFLSQRHEVDVRLEVRHWITDVLLSSVVFLFLLNLVDLSREKDLKIIHITMKCFSIE